MDQVGIVGSRDFEDYEMFKRFVEPYGRCRIFSGGAKGADTLAERYAEENNYPITRFLPDWNKYGRSAGMIRNKDIVKFSDKVIAFWDGRSPGTLNSIELAKRENKPVEVIYFSKSVQTTKEGKFVYSFWFNKREVIHDGVSTVDYDSRET